MTSAKWFNCDDFSFVVAYVDNVPCALGFYNVIKSNTFTIGPVAVVKKYRMLGLGSLIMRMLIRRAYNSGHKENTILTPALTEGFFASLGYTRTSSNEANNYIHMQRQGDVTGRC